QHALYRIRATMQCSQSDFARRLGVAENSYRVWESGLRAAHAAIVAKAKRLGETDGGRLRSLHELASDVCVHARTLRKAAHDGRLVVRFSTRAVFGHVVAFASREAVQRFMRQYYRQTTRWNRPHAPVLSEVPIDYAQRLVDLRRRLGLSQSALAARVR